VGRRILLLVTDLEIGGTPTVVRELAVRLNDPPSVVVEVACLADRGPVAGQLESAHIRTTVLTARGVSDLGAIGRLVRLIRDRGFDTVFSFLIHANAAAAASTPFCPGVRFFQSIQTTQPYPRWHWKLQSVIHHAAERIVVPSRSVADAAEHWADIPTRKMVIVPNAVDPQQFSRGTGFQPVRAMIQRRRSHGLKTRATGEPIPIGFIGRLDPIKRIPDLLHAVRLLHGKVHLHIFGTGSERSRIESLVRELGLSDAVTMHGAIERPQEALQQIDLLVLPSAAEGFGLVLIEAMAAGVPVVATDVAGIRDVVRNGETGLLVPAGSPPDLARAIDRILFDNGLRDRLVTEGHKDVARRFSWDVVLPRYRQLLGIATLRPQPQELDS
jgi:glycosyltransferase involved in cell wall biosynthesis